MKRLILIAAALTILTSCSNQERKTYPIVDKYEYGDKCFLVIEQEVTPEEYIGYDIGDDYEAEQME